MNPKKWSDTPYYETGYQPPEETEKKTGVERYFKKSDTQASPILYWYYREFKKKKAGLKNDLDIADIRAAQMGVKNEWLAAVNAEPKAFDRPEKKDWDTLFSLKNQYKS